MQVFFNIIIAIILLSWAAGFALLNFSSEYHLLLLLAIIFYVLKLLVREMSKTRELGRR